MSGQLCVSNSYFFLLSVIPCGLLVHPALVLLLFFFLSDQPSMSCCSSTLIFHLSGIVVYPALVLLLFSHLFSLLLYQALEILKLFASNWSTGVSSSGITLILFSFPLAYIYINFWYYSFSFLLSELLVYRVLVYFYFSLPSDPGVLSCSVVVLLFFFRSSMTYLVY